MKKNLGIHWEPVVSSNIIPVDMILEVPNGFPDSPSLTAHTVHDRLVHDKDIYVQNCQITMFVLIMVFICLVPSLSKVLKTALCTL